MFFVPMMLGIILSVFATAVMSYISMAVPIGPWIAPTLVLCASFLIRFVSFGSIKNQSKFIILSVVMGSVGGIIATAIAFSVPALYFLDPVLFNEWLSRPFYFVALFGMISFVSGWFGIWMANMTEHRLLIQEQLDFPIGQLVYKMIIAQEQTRKSFNLAVGYFATLLFCFLQGELFCMKAIIPRFISVIPSTTIGLFRFPTIRFDLSLLPMLWSIGFVTGHVIAVPLLVGALTQIFLTGPLQMVWFTHLSAMEFVLAFGSGMVLSGVIPGLTKTGKSLFHTFRSKQFSFFKNESTFFSISKRDCIELICLLVVLSACLSYLQFSIMAQIYIVLATAICSYQVAVIAGQIGLARLGSFATFVMVPGMLFFNLNFVQVILLSAFVEIAVGVIADILFGRKAGYLAQIDSAQIRRYQYIGLVVSSISVGIVFWLLISHFQLGSSDLMAIKAKSRQMLIHLKQFDHYILTLGALFGFFLQWIRVNPMLVLGGLLMPIDFSLGLIGGGLCALLMAAQREKYYPFWSGVFAANSIWMLIRALARFFCIKTI